MHSGAADPNLELRRARIRQANALAKSGQELDLNEKRLLLLAMARIKSSDTELLTHKIGMKELGTHLGENPYARAERAARGLLRRLVYVPTENGGFREFQWTTVAEYVPAESSETGESYVKIRLNEELAPFCSSCASATTPFPCSTSFLWNRLTASGFMKFSGTTRTVVRKKFLRILSAT